MKRTYTFSSRDLDTSLLCCGRFMIALPGLWASGCINCRSVCSLVLDLQPGDPKRIGWNVKRGD